MKTKTDPTENDVILPVVYVTKYALTQGILVCHNATHCRNVSEKMIEARLGQYKSYFHRPDWHTTEAEALARAEEMRRAKIKSIQKQQLKMEKMQFKFVTTHIPRNGDD